MFHTCQAVCHITERVTNAGHDITGLIPQLKVRVLELILKMQPKLKV